ncbi:MFS transporter [Aspergillus saccharolyticus JOP 1030-1]|uniref:MFS general substrate transporter n=1 Tax=Aspergillus saccharolyticus JOP 1030-1 TaxID=1450539 RepID=A0A318Z1Y1_9EURO|nr:MFS general substrate transporter [Aspergillus saccharolyticus JOP 1030-1]PYH41291.1 MFS general substrate transporter [Aspergillus saccharolyticus JOP 1030-1]
MAPSGPYAVLDKKIPFFRIIFDSGFITQDILNHRYEGAGTDSQPYLVTWLTDDPRDPMQFRPATQWALNVLATLGTFVVSLCSSAYSAGLTDITQDFDISEEVALLGSSLFVLGWAIGPLLWGALSEAYGRRSIMLASGVFLTAFTAGSAAASTIVGVLVLQFLAGTFGSASVSVPAGVVADVFPPLTRGVAMGFYASIPFLVFVGPIIGAVIDVQGGWRWIQGAMAIISGFTTLAMFWLLPETYAPVLLARRANRLTRATGRVYRSATATRQSVDLRDLLLRPWGMLFREPIVLLLALYVGIIFGLLYMSFAAYPIVFQQIRGWNAIDTGLSYFGMLVGVLVAVPHVYISQSRYAKMLACQESARLPPEVRLLDSFLATIALPVGLFWFAWTIVPVSLPWVVPLLGSVLVGYSQLMISITCYNYLLDSYTIFAASVMADCNILFSVFSAAFPLFTTQMYESLGPRWAASVPAFLSLACAPIPFLLYRYGALIRARCAYAVEAAAHLDRVDGVPVGEI